MAAAPAGRRPASRAPRLALLLLLAAACEPRALAGWKPMEADFGGGMIRRKPNGRAFPENPFEVGISVEEGQAGVAGLPRHATAPVHDFSARVGSPTLTVTLVAGYNMSSSVGAYYQVTWAGVSDVQTADRIAVLYTNAPKDNQHPIKYVFVTETVPGYMTGSGTVQVWLPLLRQPVTVAYVRQNAWRVGLWWSYAMLAKQIITPPSYLSVIPHNSKLIFLPATGNTRTVKVIWQTGTTMSDAQVRWRLPTAQYDSTHKTIASHSTFSASQMCDNPGKGDGWTTPGIIWQANMNNLQPGQKYFYQIGSPSFGWASEASFTTVPSAANAETNFLLIADSGQYAPDLWRMPDGNMFPVLKYAPEDSSTPGKVKYAAVQGLLTTLGAAPGQQPATRPVFNGMASAIASKDYHVLVVNGDISYARGEMHQWDTYHVNFRPVLRRVPGLYTPGNHEADGPHYPDSTFHGVDSGGECNIPYRYLFKMPTPAGSTADYYSVDIGLVHFVGLNSEQNLGAGSAQLAWLDADLAGVDRSVTPWVVVSFHRPMYVDTFDGGDQAVARGYQKDLEPILVKYQVDMAWTAHIHAYQRSCLGGVMKGTCLTPNADGSPRGPVHILTGNAGFQMPLLAANVTPTWLKKSTFDYGYCDVTIARTYAKFIAYRADGSVIETFNITKPANFAPDPVAAMALYNATHATPPLDDFDFNAFSALLGTQFVTYAIGNAAWVSTYLTATSRYWQLLTPAPGRVTIWTAADVWQVAYPVLKLIVETAPTWLPDSMNRGIKYMYHNLSPGGRMYFGP